jgi:hypothetical protein
MFIASKIAEVWRAFAQKPFARLVSLFLARMFRGGDDSSSEELGLGVGAILLLSGMPGFLASMLMFEKYGSLARFMRGEGAYDPFKATISDEYFFIVLSTVITGAVALWRWDSIFPDRRDYANLVPLPIPLRRIFLANFSAIVILAAVFAVVVNAGSFVLFPVAVVGAQPSFAVFFRFSEGHAVAVICASVLSFTAVFAIAGILMAILPAAAFRRASIIARFVLGVFLLALLASVFSIYDLLRGMSVANVRRMEVLPPVSMVAVARDIWVRGGDAIAAATSRTALETIAIAALVAAGAYIMSFRRQFLRIPELGDAGPLPRTRMKFSLLAPVHAVSLRAPSHRACYHFIARTLLRNDAHLQVLSAFAALARVIVAQSVMSIRGDEYFLHGRFPSSEFLSIPFTIAFCIVVAIRCAFEIPVQLEANWIFRLWLPSDDGHARGIARRVLLTFTLPWLMPATFLGTARYFGWRLATLHSLILAAAIALAVEILLVRYRKMPFTCT